MSPCHKTWWQAHRRQFLAWIAGSIALLSFVSGFFCVVRRCDTIQIAPAQNNSTYKTAEFGLVYMHEILGNKKTYDSNGILKFTFGSCVKYPVAIIKDRVWTQSTAFLFSATIGGFVLTIALLLSICASCCHLAYLLIGVCFLILCGMSQLFAFRIFNSELCDANPILATLGDGSLYETGCNIGKGGIWLIFSSLGYIVTGFLCFLLGDVDDLLFGSPEEEMGPPEEQAEEQVNSPEEQVGSPEEQEVSPRGQEGSPEKEKHDV